MQLCFQIDILRPDLFSLFKNVIEVPGSRNTPMSSFLLLSAWLRCCLRGDGLCHHVLVIQGEAAGDTARPNAAHLHTHAFPAIWATSVTRDLQVPLSGWCQASNRDDYQLSGIFSSVGSLLKPCLWSEKKKKNTCVITTFPKAIQSFSKVCLSPPCVSRPGIPKTTSSPTQPFPLPTDARMRTVETERA